MDKKEYTSPELEKITFRMENVLAVSDPEVGSRIGEDGSEIEF